MNSVDVVIPCYKYGHYLRGCVDSVLSQPGVDVRVLIIDDCSPDNTAEVGKSLAVSDVRVSFRRHEVNRGHICTYNEGLLEWAAGDYCVLLSADDFLAPGALERAARIMDANEQVVMTFGSAVKVYSDGRTEPAEPGCIDPAFRIVPGQEMLADFCRTAENFVPTPTVVARTSVQKSVGGYCLDLPHAGDMEMWMRFSAAGSVAILKAEQAFYRFHGSNMHVSYFQEPIRDLRERKAVFDRFFDLNGSRIENAARLREIAYTNLGWSAFWTGSRAFEAGQDEACRDLLSFAVELFPALPNQPEWSRLRWKQRLGSKVCSLLLPLARYVRGHLCAA